MWLIVDHGFFSPSKFDTKSTWDLQRKKILHFNFAFWFLPRRTNKAVSWKRPQFPDALFFSALPSPDSAQAQFAPQGKGNFVVSTALLKPTLFNQSRTPQTTTTWCGSCSIHYLFLLDSLFVFARFTICSCSIHSLVHNVTGLWTDRLLNGIFRNRIFTIVINIVTVRLNDLFLIEWVYFPSPVPRSTY